MAPRRSNRPATTPTKAERRYRAVDPDNRLVARGLETEWNTAAAATGRRRGRTRPPRGSTPENPDTTRETGDPRASATTSAQVWSAPTTTDKDRKQLLRTLLEEVNITVHRDTTDAAADLIAALEGRRPQRTAPCRCPASRQPKIRTDEDTIDLLRRLASHYPDAKIAGILNRQGRTHRPRTVIHRQ